MRVKHRKRQKTTIELEDAGTVLGTLDAFGCVAIPLPLDSVQFVSVVDEGTRDWFWDRLADSLAPNVPAPQITKKGAPDTETMNSWAKGQTQWQAMFPAQKRAFLNAFNLSTEVGRANLFFMSNRKRAIDGLVGALPNASDETKEGLALYFADRLAYVKQGDSRMGLSAMYKSWSKTGFGKWAHISPDIGFRAAQQLRDRLGAEGLQTRLTGGSHIIYKPPGGSELAAHTDGPRPATIIADIARLAAANGERYPTTSEWMALKGIQSLVHYEGGIQDGYTYAIGPMNPHKLYVCLKAVQDGSIGVPDCELFKIDQKADEDSPVEDEGAASGARTRFLTGGSGPSFMRWKENIEAFNAVLGHEGLDSIAEIAIRPPKGMPTGAFVAMWPVGFPHGSASNSQRRVTTTASLSPHAQPADQLDDDRDDRVPLRVDALAKIANPLSEEERLEAREVISQQTKPFHGGKTHLHPEHAKNWFDGTMLLSKTGGWYRGIAPSRATAAAFAAAWKEGFWGHG